MPETRDNKYNYKKLVLDITSGEATGVAIKICKSCSSIVDDTKIHNKWHKENDK